MKPFVVNRHGRLVFPANFLGQLDFSVLHTLEQFTAVIGRDFEAKAPTGSDILDRIESGIYRGRFELLRDLGQDLFWVNRFSMTMYEKRPTRWRDVAKRRGDVFLPVLTPWEDGERKVAAVQRAYAELPATWNADVEDKVFALLFDVFSNKLHHATELPAIKPTVAEFLDQPDALTFVTPDYDPDYPTFGVEDILDADETVPELEALMRWAMVLHNQYPWDRSRTELRRTGDIGAGRLRGRLPPPQPRGDGLHRAGQKRPGRRAERIRGPRGRPEGCGVGAPRAGRGGGTVRPVPAGAGAGVVRGPAEVRGAGGGARRARLQQRRRHPQHELLVVADERGRNRHQDRHRATALHQPRAPGTGAPRRAGCSGEVGPLPGRDRGRAGQHLQQQPAGPVDGLLAVRTTGAGSDPRLGRSGRRLRRSALRAG